MEHASSAAGFCLAHCPLVVFSLFAVDRIQVDTQVQVFLSVRLSGYLVLDRWMIVKEQIPLPIFPVVLSYCYC